MQELRDVNTVLVVKSEVGHTLLAVSVKLSQLYWTYRKPSIVWHKSLHSKLPSFGFYPSLCSFISIFLSGRFSSAVVDGRSSSNKPINSGVPKGSVQSPTLYLLFINDLSITNCPIHSYANDSTLHFSIPSTEDPPCRTYKTLDWRRQNA